MRDALLELRRELLRNLVGEHVDEHQHVDVAFVIGPYVRRPILRESDRTNVGCGSDSENLCLSISGLLHPPRADMNRTSR
jgi:hypothetical protein